MEECKMVNEPAPQVNSQKQKTRERLKHCVASRTGGLRLYQIIGDPKADPPVPAILPISKSQFYAGIKKGKYPAPSKKFGPRTSVWLAEEIFELVESN
jgi:predicted DNA-binding transcriptional regulator AlpA